MPTIAVCSPPFPGLPFLVVVTGRDGAVEHVATFPSQIAAKLY